MIIQVFTLHGVFTVVAGEEGLVPERALRATYGRLTVNDIAPCTATYIMQTKLGQLLALPFNNKTRQYFKEYMFNIIKIQL